MIPFGGATVMIQEDPRGEWQLAEEGRTCRATVPITAPGEDRPLGWRACNRPAVFKLNRRRAASIKTPLWCGYCDDLPHSYNRVLVEGAIYFVYTVRPEQAAAIAAALAERLR